MNMLVYSFRVLQSSTTRSLEKPAVIIGSSVHPFAAVAGAILARRFQVPFIFEVRDLWPQTLVDMGRIDDGAAITWALRKLEIWLYRRAARIIVLLPHAHKYIVPLGIPLRRIDWIPNGTDLSLFPVLPSDFGENSEVFTFMYIGAHGEANGLETVLYALSLIQAREVLEESKRRIRMRIVGDGPLKSSLVALSKKLGLQNVSFDPPVPKYEVPKIAAEADAFVISVKNLPKLYQYGISANKLFDYLAAARPVLIASCAANNPVADANAGITIKPEDPEDMASAMLQLAALSGAERACMGNAGRRYVEANHSFEFLGHRLAGVLDAVTN